MKKAHNIKYYELLYIVNRQSATFNLNGARVPATAEPSHYIFLNQVLYLDPLSFFSYIILHLYRYCKTFLFFSRQKGKILFCFLKYLILITLLFIMLFCTIKTQNIILSFFTSVLLRSIMHYTLLRLISYYVLLCSLYFHL